MVIIDSKRLHSNEIKERKLSEAREKHLNQVLRAVRNINQLIVQEKDRDRLLKKACAILLDTRFYSHAWIILTDASGKLITAAQAGLGESFPELVRQIEHGEPPYCVRKAKKQPNILLIENTGSACDGCPLPGQYPDRSSAIVRLAHGGKIFGFLTISFPMEMILDEEEKPLLIELAGDVAFALYNCEQEEKKARAEKALHESEERFRELADSLPQIVFEMDEAGTLAFLNKNALNVFGYSQSDFDKGLNAFDMIVAEDHDRALANIERMNKGDSPGGSEYTAIRKNGSTFPVILHATPVLLNNKPVGLRGIMINLTERKKMEADLTCRAMAMDHATDAIVITDTAGTIIYVNPAFEKNTGYNRKETLGQNPRILQSGKQDEVFYHDLWQTISGGRTWSGRFINKRKNGSNYTEEVTISPVFSPSGYIVNYVAVKRDITDRINLETKLRQAHKMEAIGTLAGGIAHDFNNILGVIMGRAELSQFVIPKDNPAYKNITQLIKAGNRAKDLVQQILAFSRQKEYERKPMQPGPIIKEALKMLRSSLPSTIKIKHNIAAQSGVVLADPTQIHQIVINLCTNAYHAMEKTGGVLTVSLAKMKFDASDTNLNTESGPEKYTQLTVGDTGHGMESHIIERIFDPYFTTKKLKEGTGLGLAVVHGIVNGYGGSISVESEVGKGTTFKVLLPRIEYSEKTMKIEDPGPIPKGNERILFVDDEKDLVDTGQEILECLGYLVTAETSSINALELFRTRPGAFDLVITDYTMPNMTGADLAKALMQIRPEIPVILCTGFSELISEEKSKRMGIKAFMMKPFVMRKIAEIIRKVLDG